MIIRDERLMFGRNSILCLPYGFLTVTNVFQRNLENISDLICCVIIVPANLNYPFNMVIPRSIENNTINKVQYISCELQKNLKEGWTNTLQQYPHGKPHFL